MPPFGAPLTTTIFTSVGFSASVVVVVSSVVVVSVVVVVCSVVVVSVDDALSESFEPQPTRAIDATVDAAMSRILFTGSPLLERALPSARGSAGQEQSGRRPGGPARSTERGDVVLREIDEQELQPRPKPSGRALLAHRAKEPSREPP